MRKATFDLVLPLANVILVSVYPVWTLFAINATYLSLSQTVLPAVLSVIYGLIVLLVSYLFLRQIGKASLISMAWLILSFFYGTVYDTLSGYVMLKHWQLVAGSFFIFCIISILILYIKKSITVGNLHKIILLPLLLLFVYNSISIAATYYDKHRIRKSQPRAQMLLPDTGNSPERPDVYFIVFDEFASFGTIKEGWGYDVDWLQEKLEGLGFYVATESRTRHAYTSKSLATLLNLEYMGNEVGHSESLKRYDENHFMHFLDQLGYKIYFLDGYGSFTYSFGIENVTFKCMYNTQVEDEVIIDPFHFLFLNQTLLKPYLSYFRDSTANLYYRVNKYFINFIEQFPVMEKETDQPFLLYGHLMTPHLPYVFDRHGHFHENPTNYWEYESLEDEEKKKLYLEQYIYVSTRIGEMAESILKQSQQAPVIMFFSDHGPRGESTGIGNPEYRHRVLNAVYFPNQDYHVLYRNIAPVNTLRAMMNRYFGQSYEMLDDF